MVIQGVSTSNELALYASKFLHFREYDMAPKNCAKRKLRLPFYGSVSAPNICYLPNCALHTAVWNGSSVHWETKLIE